jgi:UDP-N-acetylglucosamine diphosphorylase/glucosamine-1-phosphate N-acetyltransferase
MRVCLFEDRGVADLEPLTLTRPAFALFCGQTSLAAKQHRFFCSSSRGALVRPHLAALTQLHDPSVRVNDPHWLADGPVVLVNARWLPSGPMDCPPREPCVGLVGDEVAFAVVESAPCDGSPAGVEEMVRTWKRTLPAQPAGGQLIRYPWELVQHNGEQIVADWEAMGRPRPPEPAAVPAVVGSRSGLVIDPAAHIEPMVLADTRGGPVVIAREAVVTAFSRLEGPCYIGPGTQVQGAKIRAGTTLGPQCRIGGEIEASIVQGHSNKYHDGFLGHAYVGEWVNLGAGTQNSDLRNDYGEVRVQVNGRLVNTGQTKVGCFLGDHTKSGLGTLLNTGTSVGVFCHLLPSGGLLPRHVPSFGTCDGNLHENANLSALLATAEVVMRRRGQVLTEAHAALYALLFEQTALERRRALVEVEAQRLRRSA